MSPRLVCGNQAILTSIQPRSPATHSTQGLAVPVYMDVYVPIYVHVNFFAMLAACLLSLHVPNALNTARLAYKKELRICPCTHGRYMLLFSLPFPSHPKRAQQRHITSLHCEFQTFDPWETVNEANLVHTKIPQTQHKVFIYTPFLQCPSRRQN